MGNIKTIILCGGKGFRLREETEFKPKPMIEIGGKPILWHIMKIYAAAGFSDFVLALGYRGEYIRNFFLHEKNMVNDFLFNTKEGKVLKTFENNHAKPDDFNIIFAHTGLDTPHGERVAMLKKYVDEDTFMVTYGDGVGNIDIKKLVEFHKSKNVIATVTGVHPTSRWGIIDVGPDNILTDFQQKPDSVKYVNGGFMVFSRKFFDVLKPGMMIEESFAGLIAKKQVALYKHEGFWSGMDTYRDMVVLNEQWKESHPWKMWEG